MTTSYSGRLGTAPEEGIKAPCVAVAVGNITLSGEQTVGGVAVVAGQRVLVPLQTDATENGIYVASASAWSRATDWNDAQDVVDGQLVIAPGATYQASFSGAFVVGTTVITFTNVFTPLAYRTSYQYSTNVKDNSHSVATDHLIDVSYFDSARTIDSGCTLRFTGTTTAGNAGLGLQADGYWYDLDGKQFAVVGSPAPVWFGAVGDGVTDDTPAFLSAIAAAEAIRSTDVICPVGNYALTGTTIMNTGMRLIGQGSMGAQTDRGTVFTHNSNGVDMFEWDGDYASASSGIGGGIFNAQCVKGVGFSGGDAIKLKATSLDYRPGEFTVDDVLVWAGAGGNWGRGFHADGTAVSTPGNKGIRSIKLSKFRVGDCSEDNQYIYLNQVTHVVSDYLQIDTAGGTGECGMTVDGDSDNIILGGLILNGNLIINGSTAMNMALFGRVAVLDINNTLIQGAAAIQCTQINNAATNFRILASATDAFKVTRTTNVNNVTGDGTLYKIAFDNEVYDTRGSFATDTFTASCAGQYEFNWSICLTGLLSGHTGLTLGVIHRRGGSVVESAATISNPHAQANGINYSVTGATSLKMMEGDTLELNITVAGSTLVVDVLGAATVYTWFAGKYVP